MKILGKVIAVMVFAGLFNGNVMAKDFSDLADDHWAKQEIQELANDEVVVGYPDDTFRPDQPATRSEFVTMAIKALWQEHAEPVEIHYYKDVPEDHWAYDMIQKAADFDLLKGNGEMFRPEDNINRTEAISIVISAVDAGDMTQEEAVNLLERYEDYDQIPEKVLIPVAKADKFGLIVTKPDEKDLVHAQKDITRAEIAVILKNMREQALLHPSEKLEEALKPKMADGKVIPGVYMDENGIIAYIPAGTIIEGYLQESIYNQKAKEGEVFLIKTAETYITSEGYLLLPQGTNVIGKIDNIKKAKYFIRNGKLDMESERARINEVASDFPGNINHEIRKENWFMRMLRYIIKGRKVNLEKQETVYVKLTEPVKVDVTKTIIVN